MPWPSNTRYLGKSTPRAEGPAKVTGRAKYTTDVAPPGMLFGAILRSKWPAANIRSVNVDKARAAPGIRAAFAMRNGNFTVRYAGDEIAAVAGTSRNAVLEALELIEVDAEPLPFVVNELEAIKENAPPVVPDQPNLGEGRAKVTGDVDAAFASAAAVIEGEYGTQVELHHPMEQHGHVAQWDGDELTVWSSTQAVFGVRGVFAQQMNVPQSKVRVICEHMGGGFGSKFGPGVEGIVCARLAQIAGAPVRLILSRREQALAVGNRPSSFQTIKIGADASGKLTAFELKSFGTPGHTTGVDGGGGSGGAGFPAPYIYTVPAIRVQQGSVAVNAGPSCAMRAPGHPVASVGMEGALDDLAAKLGIDPVEMRLKNDPSEIRRREYEIGAERFGWKEKFRKPGTSLGPVKTGVGCAGAAWMSWHHNCQVEARVNNDSTVEILVGTQDLGTGSRTVAQVVAAEILGIDPSLITVRVGDSRLPPSGGSGGSQTTASVAPAVLDACEKVLVEIKRISGNEDPRSERWIESCRKIAQSPLIVRGEWKEGFSNTGACGVQFAEVEVDTETGFVKLRKMLAVQDCGTVVNKLTCESQINGGVIMGIGYALYEQRIMDDRTGVVLNQNLETYKLPGVVDIPEIDILLLDMPERGVIGVGEPCTIPTASAIANAVANALGVRVGSLPITPDKVLAALGKLPKSRDAALIPASRNEAFAQVSTLPHREWVETDGGCHA
jgi:xanthine dehydrogenase YagR molybdenum-binding subunit